MRTFFVVSESRVVRCVMARWWFAWLRAGRRFGAFTGEAGDVWFPLLAPPSRYPDNEANQKAPIRQHSIVQPGFDVIFPTCHASTFVLQMVKDWPHVPTQLDETTRLLE